MLLIQNEFYNEDGKLNEAVTKALDEGIKALVTNVLVALPQPNEQPFVSQLLLRHLAVSRLDLALAIAFLDSSVAAGQGATRPTTQNPLKILEGDLDTAFEKVENGWCTENSAHDMLQTFSSMLDDAKKGQSYFSDDDEDEDDE